MKVWILKYTGGCCDDSDIIGVYALEEKARHDGIIEAQKDPNIRPYKVKWNGTHMTYYHSRDRRWFEVRGIVMEEWDVTE